MKKGHERKMKWAAPTLTLTVGYIKEDQSEGCWSTASVFVIILKWVSFALGRSGSESLKHCQFAQFIAFKVAPCSFKREN